MPRLSTYFMASVILTLAFSLPITWIGTLVYFSSQTNIFSAFFRALGDVWIFYIAFLAGTLLIVSPAYAALLKQVAGWASDMLRRELVTSLATAFALAITGLIARAIFFWEGFASDVETNILVASILAIYAGLIWGAVFKVRRPKFKD